MHIGSFSEEGPTIEKVHLFIEENGSRRTGQHHEIYLSDMRRVAPKSGKLLSGNQYHDDKKLQIQGTLFQPLPN